MNVTIFPSIFPVTSPLFHPPTAPLPPRQGAAARQGLGHQGEGREAGAEGRGREAAEDDEGRGAGEGEGRSEETWHRAWAGRRYTMDYWLVVWNINFIFPLILGC